LLASVASNCKTHPCGDKLAQFMQIELLTQIELLCSNRTAMPRSRHTETYTIA
jgi:hypothetical protein